MRPVNVSKVRDPKWTGKGNELVVMVSRGEPRRTNEQMIEAVSGQIERYLLGFQDEFDGSDPDLIGRAVEMIAKDYIYHAGAGSVWFLRDHLMLFVRKAAGES